MRLGLRPRLNGRAEELEGLCAFLAYLETLKQPRADASTTSERPAMDLEQPTLSELFVEDLTTRAPYDFINDPPPYDFSNDIYIPTPMPYINDPAPNHNINNAAHSYNDNLPTEEEIKSLIDLDLTTPVLDHL